MAARKPKTGKTRRRTVKRKKALPMKAWIEAIKNSKKGGQAVEGKIDKSPKRRGGL